MIHLATIRAKTDMETSSERAQELVCQWLITDCQCITSASSSPWQILIFSTKDAFEMQCKASNLSTLIFNCSLPGNSSWRCCYLWLREERDERGQDERTSPKPRMGRHCWLWGEGTDLKHSSEAVIWINRSKTDLQDKVRIWLCSTTQSLPAEFKLPSIAESQTREQGFEGLSYNCTKIGCSSAQTGNEVSAVQSSPCSYEN